MTISPPAALLGVQEPTYRAVPRAKTSAGQEAVELAASAGLVLEPHQAAVLEGALAERADGNWAAFEVGVVEPRQNGKGGIIEARELAGLYLFGEELQTHTAHRFDTCLEGFRRIKELIEGTPDLSRRVRKITEAHGQEAIELKNPTQRLNFKARAKGSGRGFSGDTVYLDEAFWLMELGSLLPTMSARPNPQLWYLSSAPLPRMESDILRRVCRRGRRAAKEGCRERLAYFEWCAELDADPADREAWERELLELLEDDDAHLQALRRANPGLGYRLTEEFAASERGAMTTEEYARERLGIYPELPDNSEPPKIDPNDWQSCVAPESKPVDPVTFAFEVSVDRKWSVIAAASPSTIDGMHVELIDNRRRTGWVVNRLVELAEKHKPAAIVANPSGPAGGLLADCAKAGLEITEVSASDYAKACSAAYDDISEHRWRHTDQEALNMAVGGAKERTVGDSWVFDRRGGTDISPLVAVSLAAWASRKPGEEPKESDFFVI